MKKFTFCIIIVFAFAKAVLAQETNTPYTFTDLIDLEANAVISQGNTGTCWSFSTSSFLESEVHRITGKKVDLSEMYTVRNTYPMKAENYVMRQGKAQFSEGGLAHDVLNSVTQFGLVPIDAYTGLAPTENKHNHAEMVAVIKAMLNVYIDNPGRRLSKKWKPTINAVLDTYLGNQVTNFSFEGKSYTPKSFANTMGINPNEYVSLTSFTHGVAVIPAQKEKSKLALLGPEKEKIITQKYRQDEFENYNTTDDHLMHITGKAKDQNGTIYYKVKNSWGTNPNRTAYEGYVYMSVSYIRLKAISILVHNDGVPNTTLKKIKKR